MSFGVWLYSLVIALARGIVTRNLFNATAAWKKPARVVSRKAIAASEPDVVGAVRALKISTPSESRVFGDASDPEPAILNVTDENFFVRVATRFDVGFGEAYLAGELESPDLLRVLIFLVHLRDTTRKLSKPQFDSAVLATISSVGRLHQVLQHLMRRNSVSNTRQNIAEHYDLGNEFYSLFLDSRTMAYSCALWDEQHNTLELAQANKIARLASLLSLQEPGRVLEVGNGWGGLSLHLAKSGHHVTGLTLSSEQQRHVDQLVRAHGVDDRVETLLADYRLHEPDELYDGIVSCEMLEAVGHEFLPAFFENMNRMLATGGRLVLQVIITPDPRYERYKRLADFIQLYVFPGGHCPSMNAIAAALEGTDLVIEHVHNIGPHYAPTLKAWRDRFEAQLDQVRAQGFDERFIRLWRYYLIYCEAAFVTETMNVLHIVMRKH